MYIYTQYIKQKYKTKQKQSQNKSLNDQKKQLLSGVTRA